MDEENGTQLDHIFFHFGEAFRMICLGLCLMAVPYYYE